MRRRSPKTKPTASPSQASACSSDASPIAHHGQATSETKSIFIACSRPARSPPQLPLQLLDLVVPGEVVAQRSEAIEFGLGLALVARGEQLPGQVQPDRRAARG